MYLELFFAKTLVSTTDWMAAASEWMAVSMSDVVENLELRFILRERRCSEILNQFISLLI